MTTKPVNESVPVIFELKNLDLTNMNGHPLVKDMLAFELPSIIQMAKAYCIRDYVMQSNDSFAHVVNSRMNQAFMKSARKAEIRSKGFEDLFEFYLQCTPSELVCMGW